VKIQSSEPDTFVSCMSDVLKEKRSQALDVLGTGKMIKYGVPLIGRTSSRTSSPDAGTACRGAGRRLRRSVRNAWRSHAFEARQARME
jgi:hypothetical protein